MANLLSTSVTGTINSTGNTTAAGFTGNANVGGTGAATWHPNGIYSGSTQWLYGTTYRNNASTSGQGQMYFDGNYGYGMVGLYSDVRYQAVFAMGDSYKLPVDGTGPGSLYGIAWTHSNIGAESKAGLGHQALFMMNGRTYTAIGSGIWTDGTITTTSHGTSANWNTAYSYGNHASAGYLTSIPAHTHTIANVTGLQTALDGKQAAGSYLTTSGKAADSELIDGIDSSRIVFGSGASKVEGHTNANSQVNSGFYENGGGGSNWPSQTWYNSINVRHSNQGNYHGFQVAMSYYDNLLWFRSYQGSGTFQSWVYAISSANIGSQSVSYATTAGSAPANGGTSSNTNSISNAVGEDYTWTGQNYFNTDNGGQAVNNSNSASLQATSTGNNSAFMSFHRRGYYAINFGLDDDNVMRIGGWSAAANRWQLDSSGNMTAAGDITAFSDARVKTNVQTIEGALEKTLKLRGVTYNRIDSNDTATKLGVIAQEVLAIIPEVVSQDNNGTYGVSYGNIVGLLIEAIKEQQAQIDDLKKRLGE